MHTASGTATRTASARTSTAARSRRAASVWRWSRGEIEGSQLLGLLLGWVLVRYRFPGRRIVDALIDLPDERLRRRMAADFRH